MKRIRTLVVALVMFPLMTSAVLAQTGSAVGLYGEIQQFGGSAEVFGRAEDRFAAGDYDQALSLLRNFVLRYHSAPQAPQAYTYIGQILVDRQQYTDALLYLERIEEGQRSPRVRLLIGYCLVSSGELEIGQQQLQSLVDEPTLDARERERLFYGLALASLRQERYLASLVFFDRALPYAAEPQRLLEEVHLILQQYLSENELKEVAFMLHDRAIGMDARLQLARLSLTRQDTEGAQRQLQTILASPVEFPYRSEAAQLVERFSQSGWLQQDAIGVLLPLSGRYSAFGDLVRRSMELALNLHNATQPPLRFLFRDSQGDAEMARQVVADLATQERVIAIAGPLSGAAAVAAAEQAQQDRTPILALSQRGNLPSVGDYVFRNSLTSRQQVRALVRYAIQEQGMTSFGVLFPENRLGQDMADLFTEEVRQYGGLVTDVQSYADDATDFKRQIRLLMGQDPDAKEEVQLLPETEEELLADLFVPDLPDYPPVTFDALFIPDYADRVGLIAPQLAFYGIEDLPLLGINGWNSPELVRLAGRFVKNAVFVDGFFPASDYPFVREFVNLYLETYGEEPSILEAQAFDVANILMTLAVRPDIHSRAEFRDALAVLKNYPGVTGATSFEAGGEADKILFLLKVEKGRIVQLD